MEETRQRTASEEHRRAGYRGTIDRLRDRAKKLKTETRALYLAGRDPRTPWYARLLAAVVVAYALSPIDLIPDFIPVLGYLDDLVLVPLGIALAIKMIPAESTAGLPAPPGAPAVSRSVFSAFPRPRSRPGFAPASAAGRSRRAPRTLRQH